MILEARSPSCFSDHYVLKFDGQAHGDYRGRWFSEGVNIHSGEAAGGPEFDSHQLSSRKTSPSTPSSEVKFAHKYV